MERLGRSKCLLWLFFACCCYMVEQAGISGVVLVPLQNYLNSVKCTIETVLPRSFLFSVVGTLRTCVLFCFLLGSFSGKWVKVFTLANAPKRLDRESWNFHTMLVSTKANSVPDFELLCHETKILRPKIKNWILSFEQYNSKTAKIFSKVCSW